MDKIENNLKAFTLVETLTALVLITLAFGIGIMIYLNILASSNIAVKEKAHLILEQVSQTTILTERYISEEIQKKQFRVEKQIQPYQNNTNIYLLQLKAFDIKDNLVAKRQELINIKPKENE